MSDPTDRQVAQVRAFNRFFTRVIGVLDEGLLDSPYGLTEVRVMYELRHGDTTDAAGLGRLLGLDAGYLSRLLQRLTRDALVERRRDTRDGRRLALALTETGRGVFDELDARSGGQVRGMLQGVDAQGREDLVRAMAVIRARLDPESAPPFTLRPPQPGDLGRIVTRNGELYAREYGWNSRYEALVATIIADFAAGGRNEAEAAWVADQGGEMVGAIMCVAGDTPGEARLRTLLVEPHARGRGIGTALIDRCLEFAAAAGYRRIRLWTVDRLVAAARLYRRAGFEVVESTRTGMFGDDELTAQVWERPLP